VRTQRNKSKNKKRNHNSVVHESINLEKDNEVDGHIKSDGTEEMSDGEKTKFISKFQDLKNVSDTEIMSDNEKFLIL